MQVERNRAKSQQEVNFLKQEVNEVKRRIMEQIQSMDEENLKKILDFLEKMKIQKEQE